MSSTQEQSSAPITITRAAADKSWELIQEADPSLKLKLAIIGGGL